jgi:hypothetical protein
VFLGLCVVTGGDLSYDDIAVVDSSYVEMTSRDINDIDEAEDARRARQVSSARRGGFNVEKVQKCLSVCGSKDVSDEGLFIEVKKAVRLLSCSGVL